MRAKYSVSWSLVNGCRSILESRRHALILTLGRERNLYEYDERVLSECKETEITMLSSLIAYRRRGQR